MITALVGESRRGVPDLDGQHRQCLSHVTPLYDHRSGRGCQLQGDIARPLWPWTEPVEAVVAAASTPTATVTHTPQPEDTATPTKTVTHTPQPEDTATPTSYSHTYASTRGHGYSHGYSHTYASTRGHGYSHRNCHTYASTRGHGYSHRNCHTYASTRGHGYSHRNCHANYYGNAGKQPSRGCY